MADPGENADNESPDIFLKYLVDGGIVSDGGLALRIAELLVGHQYGEDELSQQKPLNLIDEGENWLITGSAPRREDDRSAVVVRLSKRDGRIINLHHVYHITPSPDVDTGGVTWSK
ncbi:MAG TPA: NTF2 fold immunity protein [Caulobacteraceae bacterium]|jgi:hypothetical protein|nr:NTF2 fold immunity protein [Caulobacteraceae bacterium]